MNNSETQNHSVSGNTFPTDTFDFRHAHGPVPYGLTNDYLFRAVLQQSNPALKGLICSLLHLSEEEVVSVEITNPIILGASIEGKEFRLDVNVNLNNKCSSETDSTGKTVPSSTCVVPLTSFHTDRITSKSSP